MLLGHCKRIHDFISGPDKFSDFSPPPLTENYIKVRDFTDKLVTHNGIAATSVNLPTGYHQLFLTLVSLGVVST